MFIEQTRARSSIRIDLFEDGGLSPLPAVGAAQQQPAAILVHSMRGNKVRQKRDFVNMTAIGAAVGGLLLVPVDKKYHPNEDYESPDIPEFGQQKERGYAYSSHINTDEYHRFADVFLVGRGYIFHIDLPQINSRS